MTLRPALAGAAIIALLLTGCASTPEAENSVRATGSSTGIATPAQTETPEPAATVTPATESPATETPATATPETQPSPTAAPVADEIPEVTAIVLRPHSIDFLAADGQKVDSAATNGSADEATKVISYVLGEGPVVTSRNQGHCVPPSTVSTWPGGLMLTERLDGRVWPNDATYQVLVDGAGYGGVSYQTAGGYTVGDRYENTSGLTDHWFAAEIGNPEAHEVGHWGTMVLASDNVITLIKSPAWTVGDDC
jgi:hypothetical protein